jgi:hypothetical protein
MKNAKTLILLLSLAALAGAACDQGYNHDRVPNRPPETYLSSGPPSGTLNTNYRVHFYWNGFDPDGRVNNFEYLITDDYLVGSLIIDENIYDTIEQLQLDHPDADLSWHYIDVHDSTFVVTAEYFPGDVDEVPADSIYWYDPSDSMGRFLFKGQHTFFLRAVDDDGARDPIPEHLTFTATTIAPAVEINHPADTGGAGGYEELPPDIFFRWSGNDSVGNGTVIDPAATRFTYPPLRRGFMGIDLQSEGRIIDLPDSVWTRWRAWDEDEDDNSFSGKGALLTGLTTTDQGPGQGYYLFFVQARDEAGAITSHFEDGSNLKKIRAVSSMQPGLTVQENTLGVRYSEHDQTYDFTIAEGQQLVITWSGTASDYGSEVTGYRYGWDILDTGDDSQWSSWSLSHSGSSAVFVSGTHSLFIECRDYSGNMTRIQFRFFVVPFTMEYDLLFVDDYNNEITTDQGWPGGSQASWVTAYQHTNEDMRAFWDDMILSEYNGYQPQRDYLETGTVIDRPPFEVVANYKNIIWDVKGAAGRLSGLYRVAKFVDVYHVNTVPFDYLSAFMARGGHVLLCGVFPVKTMMPRAGGVDMPTGVGYEKKTPIAFLKTLGYSQGSPTESADAVKRFLPYRFFGVDIMVEPYNQDPSQYPGCQAADYVTKRTFWGMVSAGYTGAELEQFPNTVGALPDTIAMRDSVYLWFDYAKVALAYTDDMGVTHYHFGLSEVEIYNWDWATLQYDPDLALRPQHYYPLLYYIPSDNTTRFGSAPTDHHPVKTAAGEHYNELKYTTGGGARHAIAMVGFQYKKPELNIPPHTGPANVLIGMEPFFLNVDDANLLIDHILVDIFGLSP